MDADKATDLISHAIGYTMDACLAEHRGFKHRDIMRRKRTAIITLFAELAGREPTEDEIGHMYGNTVAFR